MSEPPQPISARYEVLRPVEVFVVRQQPRRYWVNVLLLLATLFSTLLVGARLEYSFVHDLPAFPEGLALMRLFPIAWVLQQPSRLLLGVPFAATLMFILLAHELGHYLYCRYYGVQATLPFFIPAPTLIGTMGAFIRIKSPIRSRSALFDIGIAGPIAGFVAATATLVFALLLSKPLTARASDSEFQFGFPLIFAVVHWILVHVGASADIPLEATYLHPTAVAAWVGMFATALNLLPGGQLDGGHIVFARFPRAHKPISRLTALLLVLASWFWAGWLLWAVLLRLSGMRHPQVPIQPGLTSSRCRLFALAVLMLAMTFVLTPFNGGGMREVFGDLAAYLQLRFFMPPS
jgi:membrane-associated protease RseP (regulator of RpoE activity)